jgi:hypothetical protein
MMRRKSILALSLAGCIAAASACLDACNTTASGPPICRSGCDTCLQDAPLDPDDSVWYNYPEPRYDHSRASDYGGGNGIVVGQVRADAWRGPGLADGIFVYDTRKKELLDFILGDGPRVSHSGLSIAFNRGFAVYVKDYPGGGERMVANGFFTPNWSLDDKSIYAQANHGFALYKFRIADSTNELISKRMFDVKQRDDGVLVSLMNDTIVEYDEIAKTIRRTRIPLPPATRIEPFSSGNFSLSPDGAKILVDVRSSKGFEDTDRGGVFLVDVSTGATKQILEGQRWGVRYYPNWTSNTSFYGGFYCRKDSSSCIYEWSITGKMLRRVTTKEDVLFVR